jgi:hypothetical protein
VIEVTTNLRYSLIAILSTSLPSATKLFWKTSLRSSQSIKKDLIAKINDRLHKGGKYDNVLSEYSSMRVRTNKNTPGDWLIKHEIQTNSWAARLMIPFNCNQIINTKGTSDPVIIDHELIEEPLKVESRYQ